MLPTRADSAAKTVLPLRRNRGRKCFANSGMSSRRSRKGVSPLMAEEDSGAVAWVSYVEGAGCPVASSSAGQQKADFRFDSPRPDLQEPPQREFAGAY